MSAVKKQANTPGRMQETKDYLRGVWSELKKVHWPDRKQLITYTAVVLVTVAIVSLMLWIVDSGLGIIISKILG